MKTSSLIDPYMVWRLYTELLLLQVELASIPVASATFFLAFWIPFVFSTLLFNHVAKTGPDRFLSHTHEEWNVFSWLAPPPPSFALQYRVYFKTANNKTKMTSPCYCLNAYHHVTQPFSSCVCLVCEKPLPYTLLKSSPVCFWYSNMFLTCFFCMLHSSIFCWWCLFLPKSIWILIISFPCCELKSLPEFRWKL